MSNDAIASIASKIGSVSGKQQHAKVLLYGDSGVGKTTAAAIAPKPLIVDCEGGTMSLGRITGYEKAVDAQTIRPSSYSDLQQLYSYLQGGQHDRETVIIDSLTEVQAMSMDEILSDPKRPEKFDRETPVLQDYGRNTNRMRKLVRAFRDLPMNVVFTCLPSESKDETDGTVTVSPALTKKLSADVMGYVDVVGYMFVTSNKDGEVQARRMLAQPRGKFLAKDRSGALGVGIDNPTLYNILHRVTGAEVPNSVAALTRKPQQAGNADTGGQPSTNTGNVPENTTQRPEKGDQKKQEAAR